MQVSELLGELAEALKKLLSGNLNSIKSLLQTQGQALSAQALMIARERISGSLKDDDDLFNFFIEQLKEHARNLATTIAQLTVLTLQKAYNTIIEILLGAIRKLLVGAGVPAVLLG